MGLFSCKVCAERAKQIQFLEERIIELKEELKPLKSNFIHPTTIELDQVISGDHEPADLTPEQEEAFLEQLEQAQKEREELDKILSGAYE